MRLHVVACLLLLLSAFWSCSPSMQADPSAAGRHTLEGLPKRELSTQVATGVDTIVFIGKKDACPCTERRIKASWKALQRALKDQQQIHVVQLHIDTQEALVQRYIALKPLMVLPGIYFLSGKGNLIELLQGEVRLDQIVAALKKTPPST